MAAELRSFYSEDYIGFIADQLAPHGVSKPDFLADCFTKDWSNLSLKERAGRLTSLLCQHLPEDPETGIEILKKILPVISTPTAQKYADMLCLFVPDYVVHRRKDLTLSQIKDALCFFTHHGTTSELAVRPFIQEYPDEMMDWMQSLSHHAHPHVRRFSSEGCRPRLPWAMALPALKKDPAPILPILTTLAADDSKFVQKSVANNLNDIAKDNSDVVLSFAEAEIGRHANTNWIIKHGTRTLLKAGEPRALALFGMGPVDVINAKLELSSDNLTLGENQTFSFSGVITGPLPEKLRLEYAVDFAKANNKSSRKVFMVKEIGSDLREIAFTKAHKFVDYTTRKHYAGSHRISILVNGAEVASAPFTLHLP